MSDPAVLRWLEIAANSVNLVSIVLAGRNHVHTWWTGIAGCILFGTLFFASQLYADVTLQIFFVVTGVLGWIRWNGGVSRVGLPIRRTPWLVLASAIVGAIVVTSAYGTLLHRLTNAYAPYADSVVLVFSVVGQFLLVGRRIETWLFWLVVNTVAVPLYFTRGLHLTALFYVGFWINAVISYRHWERQRKDGVLAQTTSVQ